MANEQNLIRNEDLTPSQRRENTRKAGIASGKARRERKKFKEDLLLALETIKDGKTIQELGIEAIINKFITGDMQAFTIIRDTVGEKPTDKVDVKGSMAYEKAIKEVVDENEY